MYEDYSTEYIRHLLEKREARLKRFIELNAPNEFIEKEKQLIKEAKDAIKLRLS